jgi:hypothetical protein
MSELERPKGKDQKENIAWIESLMTEDLNRYAEQNNILFLHVDRGQNWFSFVPAVIENESVMNELGLEEVKRLRLELLNSLSNKYTHFVWDESINISIDRTSLRLTLEFGVVKRVADDSPQGTEI